MLSNLIEIKGFEGQGYRPLVASGSWRVAALRYLDEIAPERIDSMERHIATDEVFVLVRGIGMLVLGGNGNSVTGIEFVVMKPGEVYNIKKNAWHNIILSDDAHVIVIENDDTNEGNSQHLILAPALQQLLKQKAYSFLIGKEQ